MSSSFKGSKVVSEPGAGITITAFELTPEAQQGLCTNGVRLPGGMTSDDNWERIRLEYEAGIAKRERERVLAVMHEWLSGRDYDLVDVDEVKRFVATLRTP